MNKINNKVILDTNVPAKAATLPEEYEDEELEMQQNCINYIKEFIANPESKLVLDLDFEIYNEYRKRIPFHTGIGRLFLKWLYEYVGKRISCDEDLLKLDKDEEGNYKNFPVEEGTKDFDLSDRKFVALSITHREHPPIIEAADGKWLGYQKIFEKYGVHIEFLHMEYAKMMYNRKILEKRGKRRV